MGLLPLIKLPQLLNSLENVISGPRVGSVGFGKYRITCALGKVLAFEERKFDLFDSFGDSKPWFADDMAFGLQ